MEYEKIYILGSVRRQNVPDRPQSRGVLLDKVRLHVVDKSLDHSLTLTYLRDELVIWILAQIGNSPESILHRQAHLLAVHEGPQDVKELLPFFCGQIELEILDLDCLALITSWAFSGQVTAAPNDVSQQTFHDLLRTRLGIADDSWHAVNDASLLDDHHFKLYRLARGVRAEPEALIDHLEVVSLEESFHMLDDIVLRIENNL